LGCGEGELVGSDGIETLESWQVINVGYPDNWEGTIEVKTQSGIVSVTGRGLEIISEGWGRLVARERQERNAKTIVMTGIGGCEFEVWMNDFMKKMALLMGFKEE